MNEARPGSLEHWAQEQPDAPALIEGDRIAGIPAEGSSGKHVEADVSRQQTFSLKRGGTERAVNIGTKRFYEIQIELKD